MKIGSLEKLVRPFRELTITHNYGEDKQDIKLKVHAIPLGCIRAYEEVYPTPNPPVTVTVNKATGETRTPKYDDAEWLKKIEEHKDLKNYFMLYHVIECEDQVFNNTPVSLEALRALKDEIKGFGLVEGDVFSILQAATSLSNINQDTIDKAKESF
jgi:hypothetical protein